MGMTVEDATLPVLAVGGREFTFGPFTIYQIAQLKNVVIQAIAVARGRTAKRQVVAEIKAAALLQDDATTQRDNIAARLGIDAEAINDVQMLALLARELEAEEGFDGQVGLLLDTLAALDDRALLDVWRLLLNRHTHDRITLDWADEHFTLEGFTEALAITLEHNDVPSLIKNLQRLGRVMSTQTAPAVTPLPTSSAVSSNG